MSTDTLILGEELGSSGRYAAIARSIGLEAKCATLLPIRSGLRLRFFGSDIVSLESIFVRLIRRTRLPGLVRLSDRLLEARIASLLNKNWRVVFLYGDIGHRVFQATSRVMEGRAASGSRIVVGLHNHHMSRRSNILRLLDSADSAVFLSKESFNYYAGHVDSLRGKQVEFVPSMYLPLSQSWGNFDRAVRRNPDLSSGCYPSPNLKIGLGGRYITAIPSRNFPSQRGRYNFVRLLTHFGKRSIQVIVFGQPKAELTPIETLSSHYSEDGPFKTVQPVHDTAVAEIYARLAGRFPSIDFKGLTQSFEQEIAGCHFFVCKGFLPGDDLGSPFENMNYQLRYTSTLFAGVPVLVARGSDKILEDQIAAHGFGYVYDSVDELSKENLEAVRSEITTEMLNLAREMNSLDSYRNKFSKILFD